MQKSYWKMNGYVWKPDRTFITGASSGTASTIFSYIAADVLPNTPGTEFTVENAYAADGQTLDYTADPNDSRNSSNKSWTDKASDVVNDRGRYL